MNKFIDKFLSMAGYIVANTVVFYVLPLVINDVDSSIFMLMTVAPFTSIAIAFVYGMRRSFDIFYPIMVFVLFVPSIFLFYNSSVWVYTISFVVLSIAGNALGMLYKKLCDKLIK